MDLEKKERIEVHDADGETATSLGAHCPACGLAIAPGTIVCPNDGTRLTPEYAAGSEFAGKYTLVEMLGKGGMSAVYRASDKVLGRSVAVKLLHQHLAQDGVVFQRFKQEGRAVSQLDHANIVRVHEFGVLEHGQPYIVMDFIEGESLAQLIKRRGHLPANEAIELFRQLADALAHAHDRGVLHRDLKPSNVMVTRTNAGQPRAILVDFGIAKLATPEDAEKLTATGELLGSPLYMSPEQARGGRLDARSDLYSLGCLMYEALSGKAVTSGSNQLEVLFNKMNSDPTPLAQAATGIADIPQALSDLVGLLLQREPNARVQTAAELLAHLSALASSEPGATTTIRLAPRQPSAPAKHAKLAAVAVAALVCIIGFAAYQFHKSHTNHLVSTAPAVVSHGSTPAVTLSSTDRRLMAPSQELLDATTLDLSASDITDRGLKSLEQLRKLEVLNLNGTSVHDLQPLAYLRRLRDLDLGNTPVTSTDLAPIAKLPLVRLAIASKGIGDEGVRTIAQIKSLQALVLNDTAITDGAAADIARLPQLDSLGVARTGIGDLFARRLPPMSWLDFNGTNVSDAALSDIANRYGQKVRGISAGDAKCTQAAIDAVIQMPELRQLYINREAVTNQALEKLAALRHMEILGLDGGRLAAGAVAHLRPLTSIRSLQLQYDQLHDDVIPILASMHNLSRLWIAGNDITDKSMKSLAKATSLRNLNLGHTQVTGAGLLQLAELKDLQRLDVSALQISDEQLQQLRRQHPGCKIIPFDQAPDI